MTKPEIIHGALLIDHPAQQFTRSLQLLGAMPGVDVQVYYWSAAKRFYDPGFDRSVTWDVDLLDGYSFKTPPPFRSTLRRLSWFIRYLRSNRPQVVVCYGWASPIVRAAVVYCFLTRTRILLYGDATWQHSSRGRHRIIRYIALRVLMELSSGAVSTGTFNREFYIQHGMDPRFIWPGVCPADSDLFGAARSDNYDEVGTGERVLQIGFAGKLISRKGVDELLHAAAMLPRERAWRINVIGDGPLLADLQSLAAQLDLNDRVHFNGFANASEMPKHLASFDVLVVPSRLDMRVLVTIEAMAAGAAVIVSDATAVWGPGDIVEEGVSGLVYRSGDPGDLARQLCRLLDDRSLLTTIRVEGVNRSAQFGPPAFAETMARAIVTCVDGG